MDRGSLSSDGELKSIAARRWRIACLLVAVHVPPIGGAQDLAGTTVMRSGLHSFFDGHSALLTVSEIGAAREAGAVRPSSLVSIEFRDDADRQVATINGLLTHGRPVRLELPVRAAGGAVQFRALVTIVAPMNGGSVPMAVLEDVDAASRTIGRVLGGSPQAGPFDPRNIAYACPPPGWEVTFFPNTGGG